MSSGNGLDSGKTRYWVAVLYPENMIDTWEEDIGDIVQLPYAYCFHDISKDTKSEHRKDHVHMILVWPNTTTYKSALAVFNALSKHGKNCLSTCQRCISIRGSYDYLIHDTETCRKKGKELYPKENRITGNNFDIGAYEQLDLCVKNEMLKEMCDMIMKEGFVNFGDFYMHVVTNLDDFNYFDLLKTYSGLFERLTKSNWQKMTGHYNYAGD